MAIIVPKSIDERVGSQEQGGKPWGCVLQGRRERQYSVSLDVASARDVSNCVRALRIGANSAARVETSADARPE